MSKRKKTFTAKLSKYRRLIQAILSVATYLVVSYFHISLWWVVAFGSVIGVLWGKIFCRWMCPLGIMMELMVKLCPDDSFKNMYQYHKIGCPIAWISGWLNKVSLYKIDVNPDTCTADFVMKLATCQAWTKKSLACINQPWSIRQKVLVVRSVCNVWQNARMVA